MELTKRFYLPEKFAAKQKAFEGSYYQCYYRTEAQAVGYAGDYQGAGLQKTREPMKRKKVAVDRENLNVGQTKTRTKHEIQYRAQVGLREGSEAKNPKPTVGRQTFVVDPPEDYRERFALSQG